MIDCDKAVASLSDQVHRLLQDTPAGFTEYQLIQQLRAQGCVYTPVSTSGCRLGLFRIHFLLFHVLYRLRDRLHGERRAHLNIGVLHIGLQPYAAGSESLARHDPLRDYYLDLRYLFATDEAEVERLLASFWERLDNSEKYDALRLFELDPSASPSLADIRRRYRQLASRHHPDRGGSTERMQHINAALEILIRYYAAGESAETL